MAIDSSTRAAFQALVEATRKGRGQVADLIKAGQWLYAEPDEARGEGDRLVRIREAFGIHQLHAGGDFQAAGTADHDEARYAGLAGCLDQRGAGVGDLKAQRGFLAISGNGLNNNKQTIPLNQL